MRPPSADERTGRLSGRSLGTQRRFQHNAGPTVLPFLLSLRFVKKSFGNPFHPLDSSSQVESWCPGNKFGFLNSNLGDSASAKSMEKTIYFEHSWRPGRNGDSAALNANRKTHLAQRRAVPINVFIKVRSLMLHETAVAWIRRREAVAQKRQSWDGDC